MDTLKRLNELLAEHSTSLPSLAKRSGVNCSTLYTAIARGSQLSVDTIERLCEGLGINLYEYFMSTKDWDALAARAGRNESPRSS